MDLSLLWLQLGGSAALILGAANFLAKSADVIAFKTGLGRSFIGVVLLATATSLPELGTGVSSVTFIDEPDLAAGDAFGSNLFNLLIIGLLDLYWRHGPILRSAGTTAVLVAGLSMVGIALGGVAVLIHGATTTTAGWYISPVSVVLFIFFVGAMFMIYRATQAGEQQAPQGQGHEYTSASLSRATFTYLASAAVVVGAAIWLAQTGDRIATEMEWEKSFVGTQFLAFSTSLPEFAAAFAAIRLHAPELAITAVLGSNLFNMGFILFLDDVAYSSGALWADVSPIHALTAVMAILMTSVVTIALVGHLMVRPAKFWRLEAVLLIGLYIASSILVFYLG